MIKKAVPEAIRIYYKQLMEEINEAREKRGKKQFQSNEDETPKEKIINESTTDDEYGVFHKGERKKCMAYTAQTACDRNVYIVDVTVNTGNIHDSVAFDGLYDRLKDPHMNYLQNKSYPLTQARKENNKSDA